MIQEREIEVLDLVPGMYVGRLDRPWEETDFPLQGFIVQGDREIARLARFCKTVFIDVELSEPKVRQHLNALPAVPAHLQQMRMPQGEAEFMRGFNEQLATMAPVLDTFTARAADMLDILRTGASVAQADVDNAVGPVVAAVVRNQDAYFWLMALKQHSDYAYQHATNCCALAIAFGRALSISEAGLSSLARGGLLMDIGMASVPEDVTARPGLLEAAQKTRMRDHVAEGLRRFDASGLVDPDARNMLASHHECFDGSGYPHALAGHDIPLYGRIAAMVDAYDAMTSDRPYRGALSRPAALQELYRNRGRQFQPELVDEFVRCLGVYPVGTLVELSSGEVAIVVGQNTIHRLRPRLMLLTHTDKTLRAEFTPINLLGRETTDDGKRLDIVRALPVNSYGLDPAELFL